MNSGEFTNELGEYPAGFDRHGIEEGSAQTASFTMSAKPHHIIIFSILNEQFVEFARGGFERDIHEGTALRLADVPKETVSLIDCSANDCGFFGISSEHALQTSERLDPIEHELHHVDSERRRRIEHRTCVCLPSIIEHRGTGRLVKQGAVHDDDTTSGYAEIFLGGGKYHAVRVHIDRAAEDIAAHIGNQRGGRIFGRMLPLRAHETVVRAVVNVSGRLAVVDLVLFGDVFVACQRAVIGIMNLRIKCRVAHRIPSPEARVDAIDVVIGTCQILGQLTKLKRRPALHKKNDVILADVGNPPKLRLNRVHQIIEIGRPVTDLENARTA